jgi:putative transposase
MIKPNNASTESPSKLYQPADAASREEVMTRRKSFIRKWRLKHRAVADSLEEAGRAAVHLHAIAAEPMEERAHHQRDQAAARGVQTEDQNTDGTAVGGYRCHAVLGLACFRAHQHAQEPALAKAGVDGWQTLATPAVDQPIDLAA